jgi:hypothetical protein
MIQTTGQSKGFPPEIPDSKGSISTPKTTRQATSDKRWLAIRFMARHVFCCWPRRWEHIGRVRTCRHCGLKHERLSHVET